MHSVQGQMESGVAEPSADSAADRILPRQPPAYHLVMTCPQKRGEGSRRSDGVLQTGKQAASGSYVFPIAVPLLLPHVCQLSLMNIGVT